MFTRSSPIPYWVIATVLTLASSSVACRTGSPGPTKAIPWTNAFWFWGGSHYHAAQSRPPLDALYVKVNEGWLYTKLPTNLPSAKDLWFVYRIEYRQELFERALPDNIVGFTAARAQAEARGFRVPGIQLDIDVPTSKLSDYASFVAAVRRSLPERTAISVTALPDWFRSGTSVARLIDQVDEFVPQFYDLQSLWDAQGVIASPIDAKRWAEKFNAFGKPYRIGISTFGRGRYFGRNVYVAPNTIHPWGISRYKALRLEAGHTPARELRLRYYATESMQIGYESIPKGAWFEMILPTADSIRAAWEEARKMRGWCIGVSFFRWPSEQEALTTSVDDVLASIGVQGARRARPILETSDGGCAVVSCTDLAFSDAIPINDQALRFQVRSSEPIEFFVPGELAAATMRDPTRLVVTVPPYGGRMGIHLGRAATARPSQFLVEALP